MGSGPGEDGRVVEVGGTVGLAVALARRRQRAVVDPALRAAVTGELSPRLDTLPERVEGLDGRVPVDAGVPESGSEASVLVARSEAEGL